MILPVLLLQKPSKTSKSKEHNIKLEYRLRLWKAGNIDDLIREGRAIQQKLQISKRNNKRDEAKIFSNLMMQGKINAALKMLSDSDIGVHTMDDNVIKELQNKHPKPAEISDGTLLYGPINKVLPTYFDSINEDMVRKASNLTKGAGGPSQIDAELYRHILSSRKFSRENKELREQIATLARFISY